MFLWGKNVLKCVFYVEILNYKNLIDYSIIISVNIYFIHKLIHIHTSIFLCKFKYRIVYILHFFRMYEMFYILEDRKSVPRKEIYTCVSVFLREGDRSIAKITVVQVSCYLQLKSFLTNT